MSVIVARALPDVRDGMKPVHRRVLWAMWDSGLTASAKTRKSANVVGETWRDIIRTATRRSTTRWSAWRRISRLRYPLVNGQGNFGSIDGDPPAAMRYTEAKLAKIADEMLVDIEKETVDWMPNYDATREEPKVLPAKLPNLLLNGALGIAVGMATSIPTHNLTRDCGRDFASRRQSRRNERGPFAICERARTSRPAASFTIRKRSREAYITGRGAIVARAKAEIVEKKSGKQFDIVVTEIPYQVNKSELVKTIAELAQEKKIEGIRDLRDESDREGMRIVIELKNDVPPQKVLNWLYKHTDLEKNFNMNMIALVGGVPRLLSLTRYAR